MVLPWSQLLHTQPDSKGQKVKGRLPFLLIYDHCRLVREKDVKGNTKLRWNDNDKSKQTEIRRLLIELWPNLSLRCVSKILQILDIKITKQVQSCNLRED